MKQFLSLSFAAMVILITCTSSFPVNSSVPTTGKNHVISDAAVAKAASDVIALSNSNNLNYNSLKKVATNLKGEKLTLKEKIGLRLFGKKIANKLVAESTDGKSQVTALILVLLVGGLGIHRFYLGYTWQGIVQLLTLGGCGIWALIDLIRIITGELKPKGGEYGKKL